MFMNNTYLGSWEEDKVLVKVVLLCLQFSNADIKTCVVLMSFQ